MNTSSNKAPRDSVETKNRKSQTAIHAAAAAVASGVVLLTILALPSFAEWLKQRQKKALQSAVFVDLQYMLEKQKAFREFYGFYTTDLNAIGITAKHVIYKFGFVEASTHESEVHRELANKLNLKPEVKDLDALKKELPQLKMDYSPLTRLEDFSFSDLQKFCEDCSASTSTFKAIAAGNLDDDADLDVWTIDQDGKITHVNKDIEN